MLKISSYEDRLYSSQVPVFEELLDWGLNRRSAAMLAVLEAYSDSGRISENGRRIYRLDPYPGTQWKVEKIKSVEGSIPEELEVGRELEPEEYMTPEELGFYRDQELKYRERKFLD